MAKSNSMPAIFRLGALDIRHNTPRSKVDLTWKKITNFYWGERFLGAITPHGLTIRLHSRGIVLVRFTADKKGYFRRNGLYFTGGIPTKYFPLTHLKAAWLWYRQLQTNPVKDGIR